MPKKVPPFDPNEDDPFAKFKKPKLSWWKRRQMRLDREAKEKIRTDESCRFSHNFLLWTVLIIIIYFLPVMNTNFIK